MAKELIKEVSLCPACDKCPAVEIYEDEVVIGEEGGAVALAKDAWNVLVKYIKAGELTEIR